MVRCREGEKQRTIHTKCSSCLDDFLKTTLRHHRRPRRASINLRDVAARFIMSLSFLCFAGNSLLLRTKLTVGESYYMQCAVRPTHTVKVFTEGSHAAGPCTVKQINAGKKVYGGRRGSTDKRQEMNYLQLTHSSL